jgi:hypothetical protein
MDARRVRELMADFTYKPNFKSEVAPAANGVATIHLTMYVPDSYRSHPSVQMTTMVDDAWSFRSSLVIRRTYTHDLPLIEVVGSRIVEEYLPEDQFYRWLHRFIRDIEQHEIDEWFKVGGVAIHDPHRSPYVKEKV